MGKQVNQKCVRSNKTAQLIWFVALSLCATCSAKLPKEFATFKLTAEQTKQIEELFVKHAKGIRDAEDEFKTAKKFDDKLLAKRRLVFRTGNRIRAIYALMTPEQQKAFTVFRIQEANRKRKESLTSILKTLPIRFRMLHTSRGHF